MPELKDEFLSLVAHEMKTPLTAILGGLQLLAATHEQMTPAERERRVHSLMCEAAILKRLVNDVLDYSRLQREEFQIVREALRLDRCLRWVVDSFRKGCASHRVEFYGDTPVIVEGDRERLEQVVVNLLANATKYSPVGTSVTVTVSRQGNEAWISVRDEGAGIDEPDLSRLFRQRFRASRTAHHPGMGLGLYISNQIVKAHGGTIDVESKPGAGSVFTVRLPAIG